MSIVRVGLAETKNFSEGYDLIFGKKDDKEQQKDDSGQPKPDPGVWGRNAPNADETAQQSPPKK